MVDQPKDIPDRDTSEGGQWLSPDRLMTRREYGLGSEYDYEQFDAQLSELEWACEMP